jgi:hypothetical protein
MNVIFSLTPKAPNPSKGLANQGSSRAKRFSVTDRHNLNIAFIIQIFLRRAVLIMLRTPKMFRYGDNFVQNFETKKDFKS